MKFKTILTVMSISMTLCAVSINNTYAMNNFSSVSSSEIEKEIPVAGIYETLMNMHLAQSQVETIAVLDLISDESQEDSKEVTQGWTVANVNLRKKPSIESEIVTVIPMNTLIVCGENLNGWTEVFFENNCFYIKSEYISDSELNYISYSVPANSGFKSYMSYKSITSITSLQMKLQKEYAYDGNYGIRMCNSRYLIALGTHFNCSVGQYVDLILANNEIIPCIIGDIKADIHTDWQNIFTLHNGCMSEFIVSTDKLPYEVKNNNGTGSGTISSCTEEWDSPVVTVKVYDKNILD